MTEQKFQVGVKVTNARGAWVILRFDSQGGVRPGWGRTGVYWAEAYATDFTDGLEHTTLTPNWDRARVERGMRQWLAGR
jgi:hypothetical protein